MNSLKICFEKHWDYFDFIIIFFMFCILRLGIFSYQQKNVVQRTRPAFNHHMFSMAHSLESILDSDLNDDSIANW